MPNPLEVTILVLITLMCFLEEFSQSSIIKHRGETNPKASITSCEGKHDCRFEIKNLSIYFI